MPRAAGRAPDQLRPIRITPGYLDHPEGSVLIEFGATRVICTASLEPRVPGWLEGRGKGWVTAEYAMLPRSTHTRSGRESRGKVRGRTQEIQRLIGRSLRAVCDLEALGERMVVVDCDVIQADGGTRTAAITGGYVALQIALTGLVAAGELPDVPLTGNVAAVSVGLVAGEVLLDLDYPEDSGATVDMNVVMTGSGALVEVQASGEEATFTRTELEALLDAASAGIATLGDLQRQAIATAAAQHGAAAVPSSG